LLLRCLIGEAFLGPRTCIIMPAGRVRLAAVALRALPALHVTQTGDMQRRQLSAKSGHLAGTIAIKG